MVSLPMDKTNNFQLKLLKSNQAQKETLINEAIVVLDAMASRVAIDIVEEVPFSGKNGDIYIINNNSKLALWMNGWRFFTPKDGWEFWVLSSNSKRRFHNNAWNVA